MEAFSNLTKTLVTEMKGSFSFPHHKVPAFLQKLLEMAAILEERFPDVSLRLMLEALIAYEEKLIGPAGVKFFIALLKNIEVSFLADLQQLTEAESNKIADLINATTEEMKTADKEYYRSLDWKLDGDFETVTRVGACLHHYVAYQCRTMSPCLVILWSLKKPGPAFVHEGMPVLYVHLDEHSDSSSESDEPDDEVMTDEALEHLKTVADVVKQHNKDLFSNHSNLTMVLPSVRKGEPLITFVVPCVGFIPVKDASPLPKVLDGVRCEVVQGWASLMGPYR